MVGVHYAEKTKQYFGRLRKIFIFAIIDGENTPFRQKKD
jgi:hypothetical protein